MNKTILIAAFAAAGILRATAADTAKLPPVSPKKDVTFATDIKPIFEQSCVKCHGAEKRKGKVRLDTLAAALKSGEHGKVIKPNHSAESALVKAVARIGDPDDFMPPEDKGKPLTAEQVGLIRAWIDQGAK